MLLDVGGIFFVPEHDRILRAGFSDKQIDAFEYEIEALSKSKGKAYIRGEFS